MTNAKAALNLAVFLMLLTLLSYYFGTSPKSTLLDESRLSKLPDLVFTNMTVSQFDTHGKLTNRLKTSKLTHFQQDDTHWLTSPQVEILKKNGTHSSSDPLYPNALKERRNEGFKSDQLKENNDRWKITANRAKSIHGFEKITFLHHVIVKQLNSRHADPMTFKTEQLIYYPKQNFALSNAKVSFEQAGNQVVSKGMKTWLGEERIQLMSGTHAIYQPTK